MNVISRSKASYPGRVQRALLLSAVVVSFVLPAQSQRGQRGGVPFELPEGNGKETVGKVCTVCHELGENISRNNFNRADWGFVVQRMIAHGAPLPKDQAPMVADYLAKSFPASGQPAGVKVTGPVEARIGEIPVPDGMDVEAKAFTADGSVVLSAGRSLLALYDPKKGEFTKYRFNSRAGAHDADVDKEGNIWYVAGEFIGRTNPKTGEVTEYPMPDPKARALHDLAIAPNGNIFFTMSRGNMVGRIEPKTGKVTLAAIPSPNADPYDIQVNSEGIPYFTEFYTDKIARIDPDTMEIREYTLAHPGARPKRLGFTSDGMIYYNDFARGYLGQLDPKTGATKEWPSPGGRKSKPYGFDVVGNVVWYAETNTQPNVLVRFDTKTERFQTWLMPTPGERIHYLRSAPDGKTVWIGRYTVNGSVLDKVDVN